MFAGIVEAKVYVMELSMRGETVCLCVERPFDFCDLHVGSSVCVSGVCLTVSKLSEESLSFDVVPETLRSSKLQSLRRGDYVHLERALRFGDRISGHLVQGHVEGVGVVIAISPSTELRTGGQRLAVSLSHTLLPYVVAKGSIAIDGVSLTVASMDGDAVTVALIPETLRRTTLGSLRVGDLVNIETDILLRSPSSLPKLLHHAHAP